MVVSFGEQIVVGGKELDWCNTFLVAPHWCRWRHEWVMGPLGGCEAPVALHEATRIDSIGRAAFKKSCRLRDDPWLVMHYSHHHQLILFLQ